MRLEQGSEGFFTGQISPQLRGILHVVQPRKQKPSSRMVKISNALKRLGFRSRNFLSQLLSEPQEHVQSGFDDQVQGGSGMIWARMLAYITGTVDQELLLRNEYLAAENRILRAQIKGRLLLSDGEKATLAEIAHRLGRKALEELSAVAKADTLLAWYRKLIANKFDGSKLRKSWGRPRVDEENRAVGGADGEGKSRVGL
jgi:hypothetical protein